MAKDTVTWNEDPAHFMRPGRRDFIRVGALGGLGLTLGDFFKASAAQKHYESKEGPAKSVIHITLGGGMAAQETWDPKPESPLEYRGPFGVVKTKLPGVFFSENMEKIAGVADKLAVVRSVAGKEADHGRASYTMFTGYRKSPALTHPSMGAVVAHEFGPHNNLPPYVAIPNVGELGGTGYLSSQFGAFGVGGGSGARREQFLGARSHPAERRDRRAIRPRRRSRSMREAVEDHFKSLETKSDALDAMDEFYQRAYTMISSPEAREAFELRKESQATINKYGTTQPGLRFLLARRLVESGVRFVTVGYGGWDHHSRISDAMRQKLPPLDQALAALVSDLDERGLLDSTVVLVSSEFGRHAEDQRQRRPRSLRAGFLDGARRWRAEAWLRAWFFRPDQLRAGRESGHGPGRAHHGLQTARHRRRQGADGTRREADRDHRRRKSHRRPARLASQNHEPKTQSRARHRARWLPQFCAAGLGRHRSGKIPRPTVGDHRAAARLAPRRGGRPRDLRQGIVRAEGVVLFYRKGIEVVSVEEIGDRPMEDRERYNYRRKQLDQLRKKTKDRNAQLEGPIDYPRVPVKSGTRGAGETQDRRGRGSRRVPVPAGGARRDGIADDVLGGEVAYRQRGRAL